MFVNLKNLEYFLKIVEEGSITRAASALRMTQPALSRQIRVFEEDMGWKLFERGAKSIELTFAGEVVVREGKKMKEAVRRGMMQIKREVDGGVIRIGYAPSLAGDLLQKAMGCFVQRHPNVNIQLFDSSSEEMRRGLLDGKLDLIIEVRSDDSRFDWAELSRQCMCLALPKKHAILKGKRREEIRVEELEGVRLLLLSRYEYPSYWKGVAKYFSEEGVDVKVAGEFDGIESMAVAIEAGLGVALVANSSRFNKSVIVAKLDPEPEPVRVSVGWNTGKALDGMSLEFIQELKLASG